MMKGEHEGEAKFLPETEDALHAARAVRQVEFKSLFAMGPYDNSPEHRRAVCERVSLFQTFMQKGKFSSDRDMGDENDCRCIGAHQPDNHEFLL